MLTEQSPASKLKSLIKSGETILIPGAHDPLMGRILERMGFKCCQCAGWMTGAHLVTPEPVMTMTEQIEAARKVAEHVDIPVQQITVLRVGGSHWDSKIDPKRF